MLYELLPQNWTPYVNTPVVSDGVVFRSINEAQPGGTLRNGVGIYQLPSYQVGDVLQWAILAATPTPPATLDLVVAIGGGITNLAVYGLPIPSKLGWVFSPLSTIDRVQTQLMAGIPELGKEIHIKRFLLGDPASIAKATSSGFPIGKALLVTAAVLGIVWIAKKR